MKRILAIVFALAIAVGTFAGCGKSSGSASTPDGTASTVVSDDIFSKEKVTFLNDDGSSVYRIVRPDGDADALATSQYLFKKIKNSIGVSIKNVADTEDGTDVYEILVGNTNRTETQQAKEYLEAKVGGRYNDYIICTIGKKIVIYSDSADGLNAASEYFIANFCKPEGVEGGILYTKATEGSFESITVNGVEAGRYDFVRPHYNSSYLTEVEMEKVVETVYNKTGYLMSIKHDTYTEPSDYEIIVGNTNREGVEAITNYDEYSIKVSGTKVYINGGSAHATAMGVSEFAKMLTGKLTDASSVTGSYETALNSYDKSTTFYKTWGDDFDGTALDTTKWRQENESNQTAGLNGKTSVRSSDPNDVFVSDGKFYICAREDENYYYGGMIRTQNKMSYKYGYVEMSAVIPQGKGFWVALWACSDDSKSTFDPNEPKIMSPEIDIVECFGNSAFYAANCHSWPTSYGVSKYGFEHTSLDGAQYGSKKKYTSVDEGVVLGEDFHTYGFLWDNTKMAFSCDGDLFFSYDTTTTFADQECFNHSMYLIFSMALAFSSSPLAEITNDPNEWANTNKYICDWINIYQKDDGMCELNWTGAN